MSKEKQEMQGKEEIKEDKEKLEKWIKRHITRINRIITKFVGKLAGKTINVILGKECVKCVKESKFADCFIPFSGSGTRPMLFLSLLVLGVIYYQLRQINLEWIIQGVVFKIVSELQAEWKKWKEKKCPFRAAALKET